MDTDGDHRLALQLFLDEITEFEEEASEKDTNISASLQAIREELLSEQTAIRDRAIALSNTDAISTDQAIILSLQQEQQIANDRQFAEDLEAGRAITPSRTPSPAIEERSDFISSVMGNLFSSLRISNEIEDNGEDSHRAVPDRTVIRREACASCMEITDTFYSSTCTHSYCKDCLRTLFLAATRDEELYPPRCCGNHFPPAIAMRILDYHELREFSQRAIEFSTNDRLYCANPSCSQFIPSFKFTGDIGVCDACDARTHITCKALEHPGVDCPADEELQAVLRMADNENWQRCFNCRAVVVLHHGCNHMTCR